MKTVFGAKQTDKMDSFIVGIFVNFIMHLFAFATCSNKQQKKWRKR